MGQGGAGEGKGKGRCWAKMLGKGEGRGRDGTGRGGRVKERDCITLLLRAPSETAWLEPPSTQQSITSCVQRVYILLQDCRFHCFFAVRQNIT